MASANSLPEPGDVILGRYVIQEQIGRGGFGIVYKAVQTGLQRVVALKMLLPSAMVHEDMVERFRREAVLARNLNHPNTIRLYDFGQTEQGLLFIAMEYLEGRALDRVIKDGPMEIERVQRIGAQLLKSLAEAHQHGVIHRDIKPSNIFICDNVVGETDFVKVLDFGIAKAFGEKESSRLTQTGVGFGTAFYMAPEQVRGRDICPATDLYSVGLLMTELLTGKTVYSGESTMDVAVKQLSEEPAPIPEWVLRGPLGPVLQRATQKDVHLRYPSAVEMLRDLRGVDPHASIDISARINTKGLKVPKSAAAASRLPLLAAAAAVSFLVLVGVSVVGVVLVQWSQQVEAVTALEPEPGQRAPVVMEEATEEAREPEAPAVAQEAVRKILIGSTPVGARILHNDEVLGTTPATLSMAASDVPATLLIELEGYEQRSLEISLDKDGRYEVALAAVAVGRPPQAAEGKIAARVDRAARDKAEARKRDDARAADPVADKGSGKVEAGDKVGAGDKAPKGQKEPPRDIVIPKIQ